MLDIIDQLVAKAREDYPRKPVFLYGHSTGGNYVINYALRRKPDLNGILLSSPWFRLAFAPKKIDIIMAKLMIKIYPAFTQNAGLEVDAISRDPKEVQIYADDPLVHSMMGPVTFLNVVKAGEWALENASECPYQVFVGHGTADKLTDHDSSKEFASHVNKDLITFKSWEGLYHETHNEPEKETVIQTYADWMSARLA